MRTILFSMVLLCTTATAQITSFPYLEDFESGAGGWTSATLVGGDSWNLGSPDGTVIDQPAPGGSMSWYVDTLNTGVNEQSHVISPVFDFTNVPYPSLEIDIWWDLVFDSDGAVFQSSTDGGNTWQNVGHHDDDPAFAPNWFNHGFLSMGFPNGGAGSQNVSHWTGDDTLGSLGWVTAAHYLEGLGGQPDVRLRMAWINKTNNLNHPANGIAFDNIHIYNLPEVDLAITDVSQAGPCGGGYPGVALVTVQNLGAGNATFDFFQDSLGTSFPITQTTLPGFGTAQIPVELPLQNPGDTTLNVGVEHPNDPNPDNNFISGSFNCNVINGLNHCNDFENDSVARWFADPEGINSSWGSGGNSMNNTINTPFSGNSFWGTTGPDGGYNPNEQSSIVSPFFDFSGLQNSGVSIQLWTDLETDYDGGVLQYSLDGGATWFNVGSQGTGSNWYNAGALSGGGAGGQNVANWNGATGGWVNAINSTPLLDGASNVLFRVSIGADDIFQDAGIGMDDFCVTGEEVAPIDTPKMVINEFVYNDMNGDIYDFIELKNTDTVALDMSMFRLELVSGDATIDVLYNAIQPPVMNGILQPNDYFVVGAPGGVMNQDISPFSTVDDNVIGDTGAIRLSHIQLGVIDQVAFNAPIPGHTETEHIQSFVSGGLFSNDKSFSRFPDGQDTDHNSNDFTDQYLRTPGAENFGVADSSANVDIVINEFDDASFIELYNKEGFAVDLTNHYLYVSDEDQVFGNILLSGSIPSLGYRVIDLEEFNLEAPIGFHLTAPSGLELDIVVNGGLGFPMPPVGSVMLEDTSAIWSYSRIPNGSTNGLNDDIFQFTCPTLGFVNVIDTSSCNPLVGIGEELEVEIKLYPNPARDFIRLESESQDQFDIQILNALGSVAKTIKISDQGRIDISGIVPGVYSLIATDSSGKSAVGRFIKQ